MLFATGLRAGYPNFVQNSLSLHHDEGLRQISDIISKCVGLVDYHAAISSS